MMELSREKARKSALDHFKYIRTCMLAKELCQLIRDNRAAFEKEDVQTCCQSISKLCRESGCEEQSGLCAKAAAMIKESEETYLNLCEQSCKKCSESRKPRRPPPPETVYVA